MWSKISHGDESTSCQISTYLLCIFSGGKLFLPNQLEVWTVTNLVEISKPGTISRKISLTENLKSSMHLQNGNEPKRQKIETFLHKMNVTVLFRIVRFVEILICDAFSIPIFNDDACKVKVSRLNSRN